MTKKELEEALEGLDDEAQIFVKTDDNEIYCYTIYMASDKVTSQMLKTKLLCFVSKEN